MIGLRNADGHVSEIRASLPAALVLPPYISSTGTTPHLDDSTVNQLSYLESTDLLPTYESRIYDRLWDGVSYGGLDISALDTPTIMSRRDSTENLREMNQITMPHPGDLEASLHRALQQQSTEQPELDHSSERLTALASTSGSTTPTQIAPIMRPQSSQQSAQVIGMTPWNGDDDQNNLSPTSSPEMQHITPTISNDSSHAPSSASEEYIDMGRLSQVPSYNTANSSVLNLDPITNALPTYASAMSYLPVIPEQTRSRSESMTSRRTASRSPEARARPPPTARRVSSVNITSEFRNSGTIGSVYEASQTFDDSIRRISLMRSLFSSR